MYPMFAYGMNTNLMSMARRCPAARCLGNARIQNYRLRFAVHADIVPQANSVVEGVLWQVTDQCIKSLDIAESYPWYYDKKIITASHNGEDVDVLVYVMTGQTADSAPGMGYYQMCMEGYLENGVSTVQLSSALDKRLKSQYTMV